jgi:C4-dicarboxylate-specific signal transduction histidine kinase
MAEAAMPLSTEPSLAILDRLPANVAVLDRHGVVSQVNRRWRLFAQANGYSDGSLGVGLNYLEVCDRARGANAQGAYEMREALARILDGSDEEFRIEYPCHSPAGKRWFMAVAGGLRNGDVMGALVMHFDISERWRAQLQVRDLEAEMTRVSSLALLGEMAAELGHEVNQPLTAALSFLYAAGRNLDGGEPDEAGLRTLIDNAERQVDRAGRIIRDLRRFVGRLAPSVETLAVKPLVDEAVALATIGWRRHGVAVSVEMADGLPDVRVDRLQITQMLINILRNAMEAVENATPARVDLTVAHRDTVLTISVADTGPGLPPDKADQLFHAFVTGKQSGMGLGLAIARRVVEAHGGTIRAANRAEGGAVFQIDLPVCVDGTADRGKRSSS